MVRGIFGGQKQDEVDVVPQVVVLLDMLLEAITVLFEFQPRVVADEANMHHVSIFLSLFIPQRSECIDNDTEQNV